MSFDDSSDDDEYLPDPDAAPTVEGRVRQASLELQKLLRAALVATTAMAAMVGAVDLWRGKGFDNTVGYLVGAAIAVFNFRLLAAGFFSAMHGEAMSKRAVLAFLGSFFGLVVAAIFVLFAHKEWTLGFALGLTTPALAGIVYGRSLPR
jgi:hypothetical protein